MAKRRKKEKKNKKYTGKRVSFGGKVWSAEGWALRVASAESNKLTKRINLLRGRGIKNDISRRNLVYKLQLLQNITSAEKRFGYMLCRFGLPFEFQKGIFEPFHRIFDFYIPEHKLIIEIDGGYHKETLEKDERKDRTALEERGMRTLRFTNEQIFKDEEFVVQQIQATLGGKMPIAKIKEVTISYRPKWKPKPTVQKKKKGWHGLDKKTQIERNLEYIKSIGGDTSKLEQMLLDCG